MLLAFSSLYLALLGAPADARSKRELATAALTGLVLAGAALTKPLMAYFGVAAIVVLVWRRRWVVALTVGLAMAVGLAPWCIRNYQVYGKPLVLDLTLGQNLAFGRAETGRPTGITGSQISDHELPGLSDERPRPDRADRPSAIGPIRVAMYRITAMRVP